jgi:2'-5' RNA ligase
VHPQDLHITLQFLGPVAPAQQACIAEAARSISAEPFELEIDRIDFWARPRIAWAGPEEVPRPLRRLVKALGRNLQKCGFEPEKRPYKPHVTLLRKTTPVATMKLTEPIHWPVDHFVLVESQPNGDPPHYRPIEGWALVGE